MARNDEGEFELVLGNRQLISVFLIVVILLGVFFSMGYIVGRNSSPTGGTTTASAKVPVEPSDTPASASASAPPAQAPAATPEPKASAPERVTTHAAQPVPETPPAVKPTPVNPAKEKRSPAPAPAKSSERAAVTGEPPSGDYWQVVATARPDAEIVAEALTKKGMHAIIAPAPKEGYFRVLVGPLQDSAGQAQTRTELEAAGFKNPIVRKY